MRGQPDGLSGDVLAKTKQRNDGCKKYKAPSSRAGSPQQLGQLRLQVLYSSGRFHVIQMFNQVLPSCP